MTTRLALLVCSIIWLIGCSTDEQDTEPINDANVTEQEDESSSVQELEAYFPPNDSDTWDTISLEQLNWDETALTPLLDFLEENDTKAFMILKDGRLAVENYFGDNTANDNNTWNSVGKTLTAMLVGIAQEEGHLSIQDSSVDYLGSGWSGMTAEQEQAINIWNHLTMTTGLDYTVENNFCTDMDCFQYLNEPGEFWFYHQGAYTVLDRILTNAVDQDFELYFNSRIKEKIGMQGRFVNIGFNNLYFSTARSMARFGILNLNQGVWDGEQILSDMDYFTASISSSQQLNPAYGQLYWLNGKDSYRIPNSEEEFNGKLIPNAPDDLYAGLGANDQKLYIVPSQKLIIVRMGDDASGSNLGPSSFDDELWKKINLLIN